MPQAIHTLRGMCKWHPCHLHTPNTQHLAPYTTAWSWDQNFVLCFVYSCVIGAIIMVPCAANSKRTHLLHTGLLPLWMRFWSENRTKLVLASDISNWSFALQHAVNQCSWLMCHDIGSQRSNFFPLWWVLWIFQDIFQWPFYLCLGLKCCGCICPSETPSNLCPTGSGKLLDLRLACFSLFVVFVEQQLGELENQQNPPTRSGPAGTSPVSSKSRSGVSFPLEIGN